MPNGNQPNPSTQLASLGEPQPALADVPSKGDLTSWWKQFKKNTRNKKEEEKGTSLLDSPLLLGEFLGWKA